MKRSDRRLGRVKRIIVAAAVAALLVGTGRVASATTLASGLLWSEDASTMVCLVLNVGATPVKINSSKIFDGSGEVFLSYDSCFHATLAPGAMCSMAGSAQEGAGVVQIDAAKGHLRGTCQLNGKGNVVIASVDMH